jgi:hypothetical protein
MMNIKLHRSLDSALIAKSNTSKEVLDMLLVGDVEAIRGRRNLNPKKVAKMTKFSHDKLLIEMDFDKGNVLRAVTSDDHVIDIEKKKSLTMRRCVEKERMIMCTMDKASGSHHSGETLKPGARGLLKAIEGASETTNHVAGIEIT